MFNQVHNCLLYYIIMGENVTLYIIFIRNSSNPKFLTNCFCYSIFSTHDIYWSNFATQILQFKHKFCQHIFRPVPFMLILMCKSFMFFGIFARVTKFNLKKLVYFPINQYKSESYFFLKSKQKCLWVGKKQSKHFLKKPIFFLNVYYVFSRKVINYCADFLFVERVKRQEMHN